MIRVWHPRGPGATEMWSYCLVDRDAPAEVKDALRHHLTQTFGPAGNFEQDDINNWQDCTSTARGWVARRYPQNIQAGMTDSPEAELGRKLGARLRGIYTRRAVMMEAKGWAGVNLTSLDWT
jgi:3-phenylpropionate/trans-cinnamate dioxygenase alpha subunit